MHLGRSADLAARGRGLSSVRANFRERGILLGSGWPPEARAFLGTSPFCSAREGQLRHWIDGCNTPGMAFRSIEVSGDSKPFALNGPPRQADTYAPRDLETRVIKVKGILDPGAYEQFAPFLRWVPERPFEVVIDCHELDQMTTAGMGLFLLVDVHARRHFGRVRIIGCNEDVARVLQTATDFTNRFQIPFERARPRS